MNKNEWLESALCIGSTRTFYEDTENEDGTYNEEGLAKARSICDACPVRGQCMAEGIKLEGTKEAKSRDGIRAGMTPEQRYSIGLRKTQFCPKCHAVLDPTLVRQGIIVCPVDKRHLNRITVPVPDAGDAWSKRLLTLARRVLRYMEAHPKAKNMPSVTAMSKEMGERWHDVNRVYEALTVDGTLSKIGSKYVRTKRNKRIDVDTWLPAHLK